MLIEIEIKKSLENNLDRDMELGYTTVGPHRDDVRFDLNGRDSRVFASQGQQRSIVLALKIAELKVFENEIGEKPVLVLDDVFSELDEQRQNALINSLNPEFQTIITTASISDLKENIINNSLIINLESESE